MSGGRAESAFELAYWDGALQIPRTVDALRDGGELVDFTGVEGIGRRSSRFAEQVLPALAVRILQVPVVPSRSAKHRFVYPAACGPALRRAT